MMKMLRKGLLFVYIALSMLAFVPPAAHAENSVQVVEAFNKSDDGLTPKQLAARDQLRHKIMFAMSVPLLIMLVATAVLGIMMGVYGKKVFVAHMIVASLSLTLAVVHGIVGIVWYFPF